MNTLDQIEEAVECARQALHEVHEAEQRLRAVLARVAGPDLATPRVRVEDTRGRLLDVRA